MTFLVHASVSASYPRRPQKLAESERQALLTSVEGLVELRWPGRYQV